MQIKTNQLNKKYSYIIVGAGIIGLTILRELLENGKKDILVIESGSLLSSNPYPNFMNVTSKNHKIKTTSNFSGVGGCSNVWGTICGLFDKEKIDSYYKEKKFPINYVEYLYYLNEAKKYGYPSPNKFQENIKINKNLKSKKFIKVKPTINYFHFSSILESENVHFLQNSIVTKIVKKSEENSIEVKSDKINFSEIIGDKLILCANTLQSIKILLNSNLKLNRLGKGFMNHPKGVIGTFKKNSKLSNFLETKFKNEITYFGIKQIDSSYNHYLKIENGFNTPFLNYIYKTITNNTKKYNGNIYGIKSKVFDLLRILLNIIKKILNKIFKNRFHIVAYLEMSNSSKNKVYIDQLNNLTVDYEISDHSISELKILIDNFQSDFDIKIKNIPKKNSQLKRFVSIDASHHMGGIECGVDASVDMNLCLHNFKNIHVCGGAIFPFSGVANPTLTYVSLAIWLSREIL